MTIASGVLLLVVGSREYSCNLTPLATLCPGDRGNEMHKISDKQYTLPIIQNTIIDCIIRGARLISTAWKVSSDLHEPCLV